MFTRKKTKRTIEDLDKFFDIADQSLLVFEEGVKSYLYEDEGRFHSALENISKLESEADDLRHRIDMNIYGGTGASGLSGDILRLNERLIHIVYLLNDDMFQFETERPFIPLTLRSDYLLLLELSVKSANTAIPAARMFFKNPAGLHDSLHKVYYYQKETDRKAKALKRKVFQEMSELKLSEKFHLRYFALHIEEISGAAIKVADQLAVMSVRNA